MNKITLSILLTFTLSGCATNNPRDPLEPYNRAMFKVNDTIDQAALKPAATAYKKVLPSFVQTGVPVQVRPGAPFLLSFAQTVLALFLLF